MGESKLQILADRVLLDMAARFEVGKYNGGTIVVTKHDSGWAIRRAGSTASWNTARRRFCIELNNDTDGDVADRRFSRDAAITIALSLVSGIIKETQP